MSLYWKSNRPSIIGGLRQFKVSHIGVMAALLAAILGSGARTDDVVAATRIAVAGAEFCRRFVIGAGRHEHGGLTTRGPWQIPGQPVSGMEMGK
jgi:hypothetical protein